MNLNIELSDKQTEAMNEEHWMQIPGYNGVYYVSDLGNIRTHNWKNKGWTRVMKPGYDHKGYLRTVLVNPITGKKKTIKVHRVVGQVWLSNPHNKPQINHKNGIKDDNRPVNLEWVTYRENFDHAVANGKQPGLFKRGLAPYNKGLNSYTKEHIPLDQYTPICGSDIGTSKLTEQQVIEIRSKFKKRVYTREMLAGEYGVKASCIKDVVNRKSWKHI